MFGQSAGHPGPTSGISGRRSAFVHGAPCLADLPGMAKVECKSQAANARAVLDSAPAVVRMSHACRWAIRRFCPMRGSPCSGFQSSWAVLCGRSQLVAGSVVRGTPPRPPGERRHTSGNSIAVSLMSARPSSVGAPQTWTNVASLLPLTRKLAPEVPGRNGSARPVARTRPRVSTRPSSARSERDPKRRCPHQAWSHAMRPLLQRPTCRVNCPSTSVGRPNDQPAATHQL